MKDLQNLSLPSRGVWIEMIYQNKLRSLCGSLPSRGVWIEITYLYLLSVIIHGRSPRGECGLKFYQQRIHYLQLESLPSRGVWIEIF